MFCEQLNAGLGLDWQNFHNNTGGKKMEENYGNFGLYFTALGLILLLFAYLCLFVWWPTLLTWTGRLMEWGEQNMRTVRIITGGLFVATIIMVVYSVYWMRQNLH